MKVSGHCGVIPPVEVPGSPDKLVDAPVMIVTSGLETSVAQRKGAFSVMAGRLAQIAVRI